MSLDSAPTKCTLLWAPAGWERCTAHAIPALLREIAIKVLPANLSWDISLRQRSKREAEAISRLSHANICTLHDIGHQVLVMEYVEGKTLEQA